MLFAALALLVTAALYGFGVQGGLFGDDFNFVYDRPAARSLWGFFAADSSAFFRPLEFAYLAWVQARVGLSTWPVHLAGFLGHAALGTLTYAGGRRLGLPRVGAVVASGYVLLSQLAVYAVLGVDTLSQVWGTLLMCGSVGLMASALFASPGVPFGKARYVLSVAALAAALLFKETSAAALPMLLILLAWWAWDGREHAPGRWKRAAMVAAPYLLVFACYLAARSHAALEQPGLGDTRYSIALGLNVPKNLIQFGLALLLPLSTVSMYEWVQDGAWGAVAMGAFGAVIVAAGAGFAFAWSGKTRLAVVLLLLGGASLFPAALLRHVSELYAYNALPFVALLIGLGASTLLARLRAGAARGAVLAALTVLAVSHVLAVYQKAGMMVDNGEKAASLLQRVVPLVRAAPPNALVVLRNPPDNPPRYSVFALSGFDPLFSGERYLNQAARRPDVSAVVLDSGVPADRGERPVVEVEFHPSAR